MGKGSAPAVQKVENVTTNLPSYLEPYVTSIAGQAQALTAQPYTPYTGERIAGFTPGQQQVQQNILGQQTPGQFGAGTTLATAAGLGSIAAGQYNPTNITSQQVGLPTLQNYQMGAQPTYTSPEMQGAQTNYRPDLQSYQMGDVQMDTQPTYMSPEMQASQTNYRPDLQYFQMEGPGQFGQAQVDQYMSPYMQNVVDIEKREAARSAKQGQLAQDLGAARQGSYGGSRQLLASLERERNLGTLMSDIQAKGQQSAFENAQQQYERDRAAGMTAAQANLSAKLGVQGLATDVGLKTSLANLDANQQASVQNLAAKLQTQGLNADQALRVAMANQQASLTTGQQNLSAKLGVQQLGADIGLKTSLANLDANQQANVQNLAAQLQTQGLNADQALRVALANQQASLQTQDLGTRTGMEALLSNQRSDLEAQRLSEQSRQFGSQQALAGYGQAGQAAQTLANLGTAQQQSDISRLGMQQSTAAQEQALQQQYLDMQYQDFLRQQNYPMSQLEQYNNIIRGLPSTMGTTTTTSAPGPSIASQIMGTGLGALGAYKTLAG